MRYLHIWNLYEDQEMITLECLKQAMPPTWIWKKDSPTQKKKVVTQHGVAVDSKVKSEMDMKAHRLSDNHSNYCMAYPSQEFRQ